MQEPEKQKEQKDSFTKKIKEDERFQKGTHFFWGHRIEFLAGLLMLAGIILSFFYIHIGGTLVGLGFGIGFFEEIFNFFHQIRNLYAEAGLFKTLMSIGTVLYLLITIPAFIIAAAIGFGIIFLVRRVVRK
jgi:hypothetical protein